LIIYAMDNTLQCHKISTLQILSNRLIPDIECKKDMWTYWREPEFPNETRVSQKIYISATNHQNHLVIGSYSLIQWSHLAIGPICILIIYAFRKNDKSDDYPSTVPEAFFHGHPTFGFSTPTAFLEGTTCALLLLDHVAATSSSSEESDKPLGTEG
jgi:hypothetical protein